MNIKNKIKIIILLLIISVSFQCSNEQTNNPVKPEVKADRIITLAPALSEIVFALGYGDRIIGNTKFCNYPEAAKKIKKIGGFLDMNIEMILKLKPNLIICYPEHMDKLKILSNGIELLEVRHISVLDILDSIKVIGTKLNSREKSVKLIKNIEESLYKKVDSKIKKKVLLIADRDPHRLKSMYIIGKKGFLNEVLELSGAINSYNGNIPYPSVSIESIAAMNPDIIIEFSFLKNPEQKEAILKTWSKYSMINAVRLKKIFFASEDFWQKPGPRILDIAMELKRIIN